jgi:hypothetical protein
MSKKTLIAIIAALVIFLVGVLVGMSFSKKVIVSGNRQDNSFQAGWNAAKERLKQSPMGMVLPADLEIKNISGKIEKIYGNKITIRINPLEPLADPNLDTRIVVVDSSAKIILDVPKDQAQLEKEMKEFNTQMSKPQVSTDPSQPVNPIMPPTSFVAKDILLSDLKVNQYISVIANENIKDKKEFTAIQIEAQELIAVETAVPVVPSPISN